MNTSFERFLELVNNQNRLLNLYLRALPFFLYECKAERLLFFKYSRRKQCFDLKVGLTKKDVEVIVGDEFETYDAQRLFDTEFNRNARLFGSSCNETIRSFTKLFIDGDVKRVYRSDLPFHKLKAMLNKFGFGDPSVLVPFKSRGEVVGFILLYPVCDTEKIMSYAKLFGCVLDKLILKKTVENLEQLNTSKEGEKAEKVYQLGKSAMVVAHEMKNALVGILGLYGKLSRHVEGDNKAKKYYDIIGSQLKRLYNFVMDINNYSRYSETVNLSEVDLGEVIDNAMEMISAFTKDVNFVVSIDKDVGYIWVDKEQLQQVFLNLFKNSVEACKGKTGKISIEIAVKKEENYAVIRVKDNCGGIEEEKLSKITEPFFTTKSDGTGLGLSIVRSIIENHRGQIGFRNVSGGLECVIKIPLDLMEERNV